MTDDRVETHVAIADPDAPSGRRVVHFQEYWVRLRAEVPAEAVVVVGLDDADPGPGRARRDHRRRPGRAAAVQPGGLGRHHPRRARRPRGGRRHAGPGRRPLPHRRRHPRPRAWPSRCSPSIGVEVSAGGVGRHYGAARDGGVLDGWLVDTRDADHVGRGARGRASPARAVPLMMTDHDATAAMAAAADRAGAGEPARGASRPTACRRSPPATTWPRSSLAARRARRRRRRGGHQQGGQQGRGPGPCPATRDEALRRGDRPGGRPARPDHASCAPGSG